MKDPAVTQREVVKELGISVVTLHRLRKKGLVPEPIRIGRNVSWPRSVVDEFKVKLGWPAPKDGNTAAEGGAQ